MKTNWVKNFLPGRLWRIYGPEYASKGRGFVLMPSSCPYGRKLPPLALANYRKMVEIVEHPM